MKREGVCNSNSYPRPFATVVPAGRIAEGSARPDGGLIGEAPAPGPSWLSWGQCHRSSALSTMPSHPGAYSIPAVWPGGAGVVDSCWWRVW